MNRVGVAAAVGALALLSFFQFPGHTYLQQDSQIYVPILEHQRDPAVLRNDLITQYPHVAFTLYDEVTISLRRLTGASFEKVLEAQQIVTRAAGILGLYLMASALGLAAVPAMLVAAICTLGATIVGPSVLSFEYEPTPRAFAVPLLFLAMGLATHRRYLGAGIAGAAAFLYHVPTAMPFWVVFAGLLVWRRKFAGFAGIAVAFPLLLLFARAQGGSVPLFARLTAFEEQLQQMRASYTWISTWPSQTVLHYVICFAIVLLAITRMQKAMPEHRAFLVALPLLGVITMPASWLFLEEMHWSLMPQYQPMRALLFVTVAMQFTTAVAGVFAAANKRIPEAVGWFAVAYLTPLVPSVTQGADWKRLALAIALGAATALARQFAPAVALAAFFVVPAVGSVVNYPHLHTPEIAALSGWARASTPPDSVFLFPDAGRGLYPGIFRSEALRAVYVDWKGGGQVNYIKAFGEQWWYRWQQTMAGNVPPPSDLAKYAPMGIQYVVVQKKNRLPQPPVFENAAYIAYRVP